MLRSVLTLALFAISVSPVIGGPIKVATFAVDASPPVGSPMAYDPTKGVQSPLSCKGIVILGGDKPIKWAHFRSGPEANPFLGFRAIRFCLDNIPLFKDQLRAILRALGRRSVLDSIDEGHLALVRIPPASRRSPVRIVRVRRGAHPERLSELTQK